VPLPVVLAMGLVSNSRGFVPYLRDWVPFSWGCSPRTSVPSAALGAGRDWRRPSAAKAGVHFPVSGTAEAVPFPVVYGVVPTRFHPLGGGGPELRSLRLRSGQVLGYFCCVAPRLGEWFSQAVPRVRPSAAEAGSSLLALIGTAGSRAPPGRFIFGPFLFGKTRRGQAPAIQNSDAGHKPGRGRLPVAPLKRPHRSRLQPLGPRIQNPTLNSQRTRV
jgi:hypothetical protein